MAGDHNRNEPGDPLTDRQAEVLALVVRLTAERGYAPTVRELMAALGVAGPSGVICHLKALRRKGRLTWERERARTLKVLPEVRPCDAGAAAGLAL